MPDNLKVAKEEMIMRIKLLKEDRERTINLYN